MIVIKFNGKKLEVTAPEERVLRILKRNNFAAKKAEFVEGSSPRYMPFSRDLMLNLMSK